MEGDANHKSAVAVPAPTDTHESDDEDWVDELEQELELEVKKKPRLSTLSADFPHEVLLTIFSFVSVGRVCKAWSYASTEAARTKLQGTLEQLFQQFSADDAASIFLAKSVEGELHDYHNRWDYSISRGYKEKARMLLFNLRDAKNDILRERLFSGELAPFSLVRMKSRDMANPQLVEQRKEWIRSRTAEVTRDLRAFLVESTMGGARQAPIASASSSSAPAVRTGGKFENVVAVLVSNKYKHMRMSRGSDAIWAVVQGRYDAAELVRLVHGISIAQMEMDGWTPLHYACENRDVTSVLPLLQAGADPNAVDEHGLTPLHLLCKNVGGNFTGIAELVGKGALARAASTDDKRATPLHLLCMNESITPDALSALLDARADINAVDGDGNTPLHFLCSNHALTDALFGTLVHGNLRLDLQNNFKATPFHYLCQNSRVTPRMVARFVELKANPNVRDNVNNSPLHVLCDNTVVSVALLEAFMASSAVDPTLRNASGRRAFESLDDPECVAFAQRLAPLATSDAAAAAALPGGEDLSDLPPALHAIMDAWNASLPPFDEAFYHAISCEPAFDAIYTAVQNASTEVAEHPADKARRLTWDTCMHTWRRTIVRAFVTLVAPTLWAQYAKTFGRAVPADVIQVQKQVEAIWTQFPDTAQRRERLEAVHNLV
ncbi:Aste57867_20672 [Aphanomyces stellatus]|uniref:Aste57867_20672 protein n=1 Tax=Aphanomyces stellatus TaxID=120398 RepID=A0A485LG42_9STRA|nr:hypothetical protein As57867_020604 [Aphanomyces stellatus]VFT97352.1 Aste57867_20672 [Aphanomyces stellatus]